MSTFFERKKKGSCLEVKSWSLYPSSVQNTWELSLPTARPLKELAFAFRIQKGRSSCYPGRGCGMEPQEGAAKHRALGWCPSGTEVSVFGYLPSTSLHPLLFPPPPPGIHSCLHWGDSNFCFLTFKRSLKAYKKALKISWTPNASLQNNILMS